MRKNIIMIFVICVFTVFLCSTLAAQPSSENTKDENNNLQVSNSQRELGVIILEDLTIADGKIKFTTATGGCTDINSFTVHIKKEKGLSEKIPHYVFTIERIKIDDCKAFFPEGVVIEYDLEKDLGLKGKYTILITNWILGIKT